MLVETQLDFTFVKGTTKLHFKVGNTRPNVTSEIVETVGKALASFEFLVNKNNERRFTSLEAVTLVDTERTVLYSAKAAPAA